MRMMRQVKQTEIELRTDILHWKRLYDQSVRKNAKKNFQRFFEVKYLEAVEEFTEHKMQYPEYYI